MKMFACDNMSRVSYTFSQYKLLVSYPITDTNSVSNYNSFDLFNLKFDNSSYSKNLEI